MNVYGTAVGARLSHGGFPGCWCHCAAEASRIITITLTNQILALSIGTSDRRITRAEVSELTAFARLPYVGAWLGTLFFFAVHDMSLVPRLPYLNMTALGLISGLYRGVAIIVLSFMKQCLA